MANLSPSKKGVVLSLVEPHMYKRVGALLYDAVILSYVHCPGRMTTTAVKERASHAYDIFIILRADFCYPLSRIEECLGHYVALKLEGAEWNPQKRRTWVPGDPIGFSQYAGMENPDPGRGVREFYTDGLPRR